MKKKIVAEKNRATDTISFYLVIPGTGRILLTVTEFSLGVWTYFSNPRSCSEIAGFSSWGSNPRLDHIIERMPSLVRYGTAELLDETGRKPCRSKPSRYDRVRRCSREYTDLVTAHYYCYDDAA